MLVRAHIAAMLVVLSAACGAGGRDAPPATPADDHASASLRAFEGGEDEVLRDLAAIDPRLAARAHIVPAEEDLRRVAMAAVLGEDTEVALVAGRIDAFSFDARARGLEAAKKKVATLATLPSARGEPGEPGERELLAALVDAEAVRLDEERMLPRSASSLIRATADAWTPPKTANEAAEIDRWLTRRLDGLHESFASADASRGLDVVRARDLDDALDGLERVIPAAGFPSATRALVRLRERLESDGSRPAARSAADWPLVSRRLELELGLDPRTVEHADELAMELAAAETRLKASAEAAIEETKLERRAVLAELDRVLFRTGACADEVPGSRVRSMAAPPEREPSCHLRHLVEKADSPKAQALALAAMHDHVVIAEWALDVARGTATLANAQGRHLRLLASPPHTRARWERIATARPVAAIGTGVTVTLLLAGDAHARAAAWATLGDVPVKLAERALGSYRAGETGMRAFENWASFSSTSMSAMR